MISTQTDPVCGMQVETDKVGWISEYLDRKYYFCSEDCQRKFDQRPEDYVVRTGQAYGAEFDKT